MPNGTRRVIPLPVVSLARCNATRNERSFTSSVSLLHVHREEENARRVLWRRCSANARSSRVCGWVGGCVGVRDGGVCTCTRMCTQMRATTHCRACILCIMYACASASTRARVMLGSFVGVRLAGVRGGEGGGAGVGGRNEVGRRARET